MNSNSSFGKSILQPVSRAKVGTLLASSKLLTHGGDAETVTLSRAPCRACSISYASLQSSIPSRFVQNRQSKFKIARACCHEQGKRYSRPTAANCRADPPNTPEALPASDLLHAMSVVQARPRKPPTQVLTASGVKKDYCGHELAGGLESLRNERSMNARMIFGCHNRAARYVIDYCQ